MEDAAQGAPYARRLGGEESYWTMGYLMTWLAEGKDTGGQFTLVEVVARQGTEPPPHAHANEDEAYYILEGEMTFHDGGQTIEAGAGDYVWLPRGVQHAPVAKTPEVRVIVLITPAGLEGAFKQVGEPAPATILPPLPEEPPDMDQMQQVLAVFEAYGLEFALPSAQEQL
jgi:quercetin dioxygenase-like cupin family protein